MVRRKHEEADASEIGYIALDVMMIAIAKGVMSQILGVTAYPPS